MTRVFLAFGETGFGELGFGEMGHNRPHTDTHCTALTVTFHMKLSSLDTKLRMTDWYRTLVWRDTLFD